MKKLMTLTLLLTAAFALTTCGSTGTTAVKTGNETLQAAAAPVRYFEGNGGKGTSIAILPPQGVGLSKDHDYLPALVQGEFVSNFSGYSAIDVLDRVALESQYAELLSGYYPDDMEGVITLGHLPPTTYLMMGKITKTSSGYALQITVARNADGATTAAYSGTCTVAELDALTGIRRSSQELLEKMGVELNDRAKTELAGSAIQQSVNAQTALAKGITAEKRGTTVEAMMYYNMAAALDTSLLEAASRSSVMTANVSSGNIGADVRNDIKWRNDWVARLTETEQYFDNFFKTSSPSFGLFYSTDLQQGDVNYQNEAVSVSFNANLHANSAWFIAVEKALQAVLDGLKATGRAKAWGLDNWPLIRVTNLNPFADGKKSFSIVFELVNDKNQLIGRRAVDLSHRWSFDSNLKLLNNGGREHNDDNRFVRVNFAAVKANDITDSLAIRVASVNGVDPQTLTQSGAFSITAISDWSRYYSYRGVISNLSYSRDSVHNYLYILVIPENIWGEPITALTLSDRDLSDSFYDYYYKNGRKAGVYTRKVTGNEWRWSYKPQ